MAKPTPIPTPSQPPGGSTSSGSRHFGQLQRSVFHDRLSGFSRAGRSRPAFRPRATGIRPAPPPARKASAGAGIHQGISPVRYRDTGSHQRGVEVADEEILSSNEELQSTNEGLETAKEELQSTNEELITVNHELRARNVEITQINNDLTNLLSSIEIAVVMVGGDLASAALPPRRRNCSA